MTIQLDNYDLIREVFVKEIERQAIRVRDRDDIDIYLRDKIVKMRRSKKRTILKRTIQELWIEYFNRYHNQSDSIYDAKLVQFF